MSKTVEYTDNGEECKNKCEMNGESYNWCYKVSGSWDYCTPSEWYNEGNFKLEFSFVNSWILFSSNVKLENILSQSYAYNSNSFK